VTPWLKGLLLHIPHLCLAHPQHSEVTVAHPHCRVNMPTASLVERRAPLTASLPPAPDVDPLTPAQWATLLAIADAFVPALEPTATTGVTATVATESAPSNTTLLVPAADYSSALSALEARDTPRDLAISFLSERASHIDGFKPLLARIFAFYLPVTARDKLTGVLNLLE